MTLTNKKTRENTPELDMCVESDIAERLRQEQEASIGGGKAEEHLWSLALVVHVTLKKLPVQVRYTLIALATIWAIVLVSLALSAGVAGLFALTGLFSHQDILSTFIDLWVCMSVVSAFCAVFVLMATTD